MKNQIYIDSNIFFYCAGCIGYRWAVKVTQFVAKNPSKIVSDALLFQDFLDRFDHLKDRERAEITFKNVRKLVVNVLPVKAGDFDRAYQLNKKYPGFSPRLLLRIATMLNHGFKDICATYSSKMQAIKDINRINLLEEVKHEKVTC